MVILNRVINILILVAAIAAVVFSYLLFSKREKLVNGWGQMATAISSAAQSLDDGGVSGTSAAKDLSADKLKHTNYEQLGQVLPKLKDNVSKVIAQRNDLSDKIQQAASRLSISGVNAKNLKNIAAYKDQERIFINGVNQFRSNRDKLLNAYAATFRRLGVSVSTAKLNNPRTFDTEVSKGNMKVTDTINRKNSYENSIARMSRAIGVTPPRISGPAYRTELENTVKAFRDKNNELNKAQRLLAQEKRKNRDLTNKLTQRDKALNNLKNLNLSSNKEINRLKNILNRDNTLKIPEKLLTSKDPECYKYVRGIIEYIDKEYGFVTVNIGKNYSFVQHYGIKENRVEFPIQTGKVMTVVRNPDSTNPLFIAKIIVSRVEENSSICNLVSGKADLIQEGDSVFFTDEDIAKALKTAAK